MVFARFRHITPVGFESPAQAPGPDVVPIELVARRPDAGQVAIALATEGRPGAFQPEHANDGKFKQRLQVAAQHVGDVVHHLMQPKPQSGDRRGKR